MKKNFKIKGKLLKRINDMQVYLATSNKNANGNWMYRIYDKGEWKYKAPEPEELILAALVVSTLIAIKLYMSTHHWNNLNVSIDASLEVTDTKNLVNQRIIFSDANEYEIEKLLNVVQKTSFFSIVENELEVITSAQID